MPEAERSRRPRGARRALTLAACLCLPLSAAAGRAARAAADPAALFALGDLEGARRAAGEAADDSRMALLRGSARQNLVGIAGAFPEKLEHAFGFPIAGLVSHAFFRDYALTFDFQAVRLVLTPAR